MLQNCGGASYGDAIVSLINREMKEHFNHVLRAAHGINAQIIQLESRTRQLQGLIDNLKDSTEFYHRRTERRLGEVEDKMTEVLSFKHFVIFILLFYSLTSLVLIIKLRLDDFRILILVCVFKYI